VRATRITAMQDLYDGGDAPREARRMDPGEILREPAGFFGVEHYCCAIEAPRKSRIVSSSGSTLLQAPRRPTGGALGLDPFPVGRPDDSRALRASETTVYAHRRFTRRARDGSDGDPGVSLRFAREARADAAAKKLRAMIKVTATAVRDGIACDVPLVDLVPGTSSSSRPAT
jgi:hypothetical protein